MVVIDQVVKAVELAAREREFLGGVGAGHQVSREPGFLHGAVDVGLAGRSVEGQVLVALVGDVDDKTDVAPLVLELSVMVMVHRSSSATVTAGEISIFWTSSSSTALVDLFFLLRPASRSFPSPCRIWSCPDLVKTRLPSSSSRDELAVLELHVMRLVFGGDGYGGGVLCLPFLGRRL